MSLRYDFGSSTRKLDPLRLVSSAVSKPYASFWSDQSLESMRVKRFVEPIADMDVNIYGNPEHAEIENDLNEENNEEGFDYNMDDGAE